MKRPHHIALATLSIAVLSLAIVGTSPAQAPARATISVLGEPVPSTVQSLQQLTRFARSHRATRLNELFTDRPFEQRRWEATLVIQFSRPITEFEYQILYYDVTVPSDRRLVSGPEDVRVSSRTETTFVHDVRMPRSRFRPNRDIELVINVRRQEAGKVRFRIVGEAVQNSGEVDFTQPNPQ
jgi:hypothetical protein